jgi:Ca2+-binding RTX toxin-like protein
MPHYENYGTYFSVYGFVAGAAGDTINTSLEQWITSAKANVLAGQAVQPFKIFLRTGVLGETIGSVIEAVEVRVDSSGNMSLAFNSSSISIDNILTSTVAEALIGLGIVALFPALVIYPIAVAVGAGLLWSAIEGIRDSYYDLQNYIYGTQDVNLQLLNSSGQHVGSLIYEQGEDYSNPDAAVRYLIANTSHDLIGSHINFSGGSDSGAIYNLGTELYTRIAAYAGTTFSNLMSLVSAETHNSKYSADNALGSAVYFVPTNSVFSLLVPVVINGVAQNILVNNVYDETVNSGDYSANKLAGYTYYTSSGVNLVLGDGNGVVSGYSGTDLLLGGIGNNTLNGNGGNDILIGGAGSDILNGGAGNDTIDGGTGDDTVTYENNANRVFINLNTGSAITGSDTDTLYNIENAIGGNGNDNIFGNAQDNRLNGGDGNDIIMGGGGDDIIDGSNGIDTVLYTNISSGVLVDLGSNSAVYMGSMSTLYNIENITGSNGANDNYSSREMMLTGKVA